jgi:cell division protein FtsL
MSKHLLEIVGVLVLAVGVAASGVWIVEVEHRSRQLFIQAEELSRQLEEIEIDWGRLTIEQSTHGAHSLVEDVARRRLQLAEPRADQLVVRRVERPR